MPDGGELTIGLQPLNLAAETIAQEQPAGPYLCLSVTDDGTGMAPETIARIFEPFYTTKGEGKGTGLGLATVFGLVKEFRGHLEVESALGEGTTFRLYFPVTGSADHGESCVDSSDAVEPHTCSGTILLVEDETLLRAATRLQLRAAGYTVFDAGSPDLALQLLEEKAPTIDLILSDIVMPGMNGPQLAREILAKQPNARTLFMSGYSDESLIRQGRRTAGAAVLEKPFCEEELLKRVENALRSQP